MKGLKLLGAGQIDAGFAAISGFAIGIYAVRTLSAAGMGAFGLLFATFGLVSQFPTQLVYAPAQTIAIDHDEQSRPRLFRRTIPIGGSLGLLTATALPLGVLPVAGDVSSDTLVPLTVTAAALAVVSPMQDHVRAMLHLTGLSWRAAGVSVIQAVLVGLFLISLSAVGEAWAPFGSLALANTLAIGAGLVFARKGSRRMIELPAVGDFWLIGRSLVVVGFATAAGSYLVAFVLEAVRGIEVLGAFESARVAARPLQVIGVGLIAVLSPRLMEHSAALEKSESKSIRKRYVAWMGAVSIPVLAVTAFPWSFNPLYLLVPAAYAVSGLALAAMLANLVVNMPLPLQAEMLGGKLQRSLAKIELRAQGVRVFSSLSAAAIGPFGIPLANALGGITKWLKADRVLDDHYLPGGDASRVESVDALEKMKQQEFRTDTRLDLVRARLYKLLKSNPRLRNVVMSAASRLGRIAGRLPVRGLEEREGAARVSVGDWIEESGEDARLCSALARESVNAHRQPLSVTNRYDGSFVTCGDTIPSPSALLVPHATAINPGWVLEGQGRVLEEVVSGWGALSSHLERRSAAFMVPTGWDRFNALQPRHLNGSVASIASYAGQGYFHWVFDVLPRIGLLRLAGVDVAALDHLVVNATTAPFQLETLSHLGLNRSALRSIASNPHLTAEAMWATSHPRQSGHIPDWACEFLMEAFLDESQPQLDTRRIFISRARATHGRVQEEAQLLERLEPLGFKALALERFSLAEKARLFHNAEAIIAPSGAGLSHLAFGQPGTVVIELMNRGHVILDYWDLANRRRMDYGYVDWSGPMEKRVSDLMATLSLAGV